MDWLVRSLKSFYAKLDGVLQPTSRLCGICGECCEKAAALRVHPVEVENIKRFVKNETTVKKFLDFTNCAVIKIWGSDGNCPFQEGALCSIYPVRPYYCRIYGHYNYKGKNLLPRCVYRGHTFVYSRREELPLIDEFDRLAAAYTRLKEKTGIATRPSGLTS